MYDWCNVMPMIVMWMHNTCTCSNMQNRTWPSPRLTIREEQREGGGEPIGAFWVIKLGTLLAFKSLSGLCRYLIIQCQWQPTRSLPFWNLTSTSAPRPPSWSPCGWASRTWTTRGSTSHWGRSFPPVIRRWPTAKSWMESLRCRQGRRCPCWVTWGSGPYGRTPFDLFTLSTFTKFFLILVACRKYLDSLYAS